MTTPRQTEQELMQEQVRDGYGNHANNEGDNDMTPTLDQMKQDAIEAVKDAAENQGCPPRDVNTWEIFEGIIPANNQMLIDILKDNLGLGFPQEMPLVDTPSVFDVIYQSISEQLSEAILEWLEDYEIETLDDAEANSAQEQLDSWSYLQGR